LKRLKHWTKKERRRGFGGRYTASQLSMKDNYATGDLSTTAGCICLKDAIPTHDAEMLKKLKDACAIVIGQIESG